MKKQIIIDTDPSPDDAVAFLVALGSPDELDVLAITTVGGNVALNLTTRNALISLEMVNRTDIPVYAGAAGPFMVALETAEYVHGVTGFDGYEVKEPVTKAADGFAPDKIIELVMARPAKTVTLCCLAPLTNIAMAMTKEPALAERLEQIVLMGGARSEGGNVTPCAEYNIYVDPEAAYKVIKSGVPIVMLPLDCTHKALTTAARLDFLRKNFKQPHIEAFYHLLHWNKQFDEKQNNTDGGPLHDPSVTAYLLKPEIFYGKMVNVEVALEGLVRGMTVVDWRGATERKPNVFYIDDLDADAYFDLVWQRLAAAWRPPV